MLATVLCKKLMCSSSTLQEWTNDYYGTKEKRKGAGSQMVSQGEETISTPDTSATTNKDNNNSSKEGSDDNGLPYMGDPN